MGTRGLVGFVVDNQIKASYNHYDSYPDSLGASVVAFIRKDTPLGELVDAVRHITLVKEDKKPTKAQLAKVGTEFYDGSVGGPDAAGDWYQILRQAQGDLDAYLRAGFMIDSKRFGNDSLFCEWGYLIDLDNETLEVYLGFQDKAHDAGRWKDAPNNRGYYGIRLIDTVPLAEVRSLLKGEEIVLINKWNKLGGYEDED